MPRSISNAGTVANSPRCGGQLWRNKGRKRYGAKYARMAVHGGSPSSAARVRLKIGIVELEQAVKKIWAGRRRRRGLIIPLAAINGACASTACRAAATKCLSCQMRLQPWAIKPKISITVLRRIESFVDACGKLTWMAADGGRRHARWRDCDMQASGALGPTGWPRCCLQTRHRHTAAAHAALGDAAPQPRPARPAFAASPSLPPAAPAPPRRGLPRRMGGADRPPRLACLPARGPQRGHTER